MLVRVEPQPARLKALLRAHAGSKHVLPRPVCVVLGRRGGDRVGCPHHGGHQRLSLPLPAICFLQPHPHPLAALRPCPLVRARAPLARTERALFNLNPSHGLPLRAPLRAGLSIHWH
eukprot:2394273-Rhodomonas_salina.2